MVPCKHKLTISTWNSILDSQSSMILRIKYVMNYPKSGVVANTLYIYITFLPNICPYFVEWRKDCNKKKKSDLNKTESYSTCLIVFYELFKNISDTLGIIKKYETLKTRNTFKLTFMTYLMYQQLLFVQYLCINEGLIQSTNTNKPDRHW